MIFSLPDGFLDTSFGWCIILLGQEIGNICSCITVTTSVALYGCLIIYLTAFLDDVSSSFPHLDRLCEKYAKHDKSHMNDYIIKTLNLHNWVLQ